MPQTKHPNGGGYPASAPHRGGGGRSCVRCGAVRIDDQIGLEASLDEYLERLVGVFGEVRRVLRRDGSLWLNIGDSYAGGGGYWPDAPSNRRRAGMVTDGARRDGAFTLGNMATFEARTKARPNHTPDGFKPKDMLMVPARLALALQADGWWLRSDVIWHKVNGMPESVADRPASAHEHVFLLTRSARYYYDALAVREPPANGDAAGRTLRNVWSLTNEPVADAHFATFPAELVERCLKAGASERGACSSCGAPWRRLVETSYEPHGASARAGGDFAGERSSGDLAHGRFRPQEMAHGRATRVDTTTGWQPGCTCAAEPGPSIVLDPFMGSGTTARVARAMGLRAVGIELNPDYCALAARRTRQLSLLAEPEPTLF